MLNNSELLNLIVKAHSGQVRKDSTDIPYVVHCVEVAKIVYDLTQSDKMYRAALCHDGIEDCPDYVEQLKEALSEEEFKIVEELTCRDGEDKQAYLDNFINKSSEACLIKIVDRLVNIKDYIACGKNEYAHKYLKKASLFLVLVFSNDKKRSEFDVLIKNHLIFNTVTEGFLDLFEKNKLTIDENSV